MTTASRHSTRMWPWYSSRNMVGWRRPPGPIHPQQSRANWEPSLTYALPTSLRPSLESCRASPVSFQWEKGRQALLAELECKGPAKEGDSPIGVLLLLPL